MANEEENGQRDEEPREGWETTSEKSHGCMTCCFTQTHIQTQTHTSLHPSFEILNLWLIFDQTGVWAKKKRKKSLQRIWAYSLKNRNMFLNVRFWNTITAVCMSPSVITEQWSIIKCMDAFRWSYSPLILLLISVGKLLREKNECGKCGGCKQMQFITSSCFLTEKCS